MVESKRIEEIMHSTREWQALHLEVQAEILEDVKKGLAQVLREAGLIFRSEIKYPEHKTINKPPELCEPSRGFMEAYALGKIEGFNEASDLTEQLNNKGI